MANQFVALPAPAANGSGAWVDVSSFGAMKTLTVKPNGGVFSPLVTIECSNEAAHAHAYPLVTVQQGEISEQVACQFMRVTISNYKGGGAPVVELGGTDDGTDSAELVAPAGNGNGAGVDVSGLGLFKTVQVAAQFRGQVNIEISEDGGTTYQLAFSFASQQQGFQSATFAADFMRVSRNGVPLVAAGLPIVWVSAAQPVGGGGGGSLIVQQDEVDVVNPATTLDFQTPGTLVTDAGGGVAKIWATLFPVTDTLTPGEGNFDVFAGRTNIVLPDSEATAVFPLAADFPNGIPLIVKLISDTADDGAPAGPIDFTTTGGDTIDLYTAGNFPTSLTQVGASALFVSDGVSNWNLVAVVGIVVVPTTPTEQAFVEAVSSATTVDSFVVALPTDMADDTYIAEVTLQPPDSDSIVQVVILSKTASDITLAATSNFADGTLLNIVVTNKTGGP